MRNLLKTLSLSLVILMLVSVLAVVANATVDSPYNGNYKAGKWVGYNISEANNAVTWARPPFSNPMLNQGTLLTSYPHNQAGVPGFIILNWKENTPTPMIFTYSGGKGYYLQQNTTGNVTEGSAADLAANVFTTDLTIVYTFKDGYQYKATTVSNVTTFSRVDPAAAYNEALDERFTIGEYKYLKTVVYVPQAAVQRFALVAENGKEYWYESPSAVGEINRSWVVAQDFVNDVEYDPNDRIVAFKYVPGYVKGWHINNYRQIFLRGFGVFENFFDAVDFPYSIPATKPTSGYWVSEDEYNTITGFGDQKYDAMIPVILETSEVNTNVNALDDIANWIIANKKTKNIVMAGHIGTVVDSYTTTNYWQAEAYWLNKGIDVIKASDLDAAKVADIVSNGGTLNSLETINSFLYRYNEASLLNMTKADPVFSIPATNMANMFRRLRDAKIPFSIATGYADNIQGNSRNTPFSYFLNISDMGMTGALGRFRITMGSTNITLGTYKYLDTSVSPAVEKTVTVQQNFTFPIEGGAKPEITNNYYIFKVGRKKFLYLSLESFPTTGARTWANNVLKANENTVAIVAIGRLLDNSGNLIKCWPVPLNNTVVYPITEEYDASLGAYRLVKGTTPIGTFSAVVGGSLQAYNHSAFNVGIGTNLINYDLPVDGNQVFLEVIDKNPNVLVVLDGGSQRVTPTNVTSINKMVTKKYVTSSGNIVSVIQANLKSKLGSVSGAMLLMNFRTNGTVIDFSIYSPTFDSYFDPERNTYSVEVPFTPVDGNVVKTGYTANDIDWSADSYEFDVSKYKWVTVLTLVNLRYRAGEKLVVFNGDKYQIVVKPEDITAAGISHYYNFSVTFNGESASDKNYAKIKELAGSSLVTTIHFENKGDLPFKSASMEVNVGKALNGKKLSVRKYNAATNTLEEIETVSVEAGKVVLTQLGGDLAILK